MVKKSLFKSLIAFCAIFISLNAGAQGVLQPLSFPGYTLGTTAINPNFYANYVGVQFDVISPAAVVGSYINTEATAANGWTHINYGTALPIINAKMVLAVDDSNFAVSDSALVTTLQNGMGTVPSLAGNVAIVSRGSNYFSQKAYAAQNAGAIAVVIIDNVAGAPIQMAGATDSQYITIPVYMIELAPGQNLVNSYLANDTPYCTITPWGLNYANDLGFVPNGEALWHDYCIPFNQIGGDSLAYMGVDGAYIANFGTNTETNVRLSSSLSFTSGSTTTLIHTDSQILASFPEADSIYVMFAAPYNIPAPTDTGHYTLTYTISSDSVDQFPGNNTWSYNFYATSNMYSKARYDFVNQHPMASLYEQSSADYYIWGDMYYIKNPGADLNAVQFSLEASAAGSISAGNISVYVYQWVDGYTDTPYAVTYPYDSLIENGELLLLGTAIKTFGGAGDTSGGWWTVNITDSNGLYLSLLANTGWYYIAAEVPGGGTGGYYLGCDGVLNPLPRVFGRAYFNDYIENSTPVYGGGRQSGANPQVNNMDVALGPLAFMETAYITSIDSVPYNDQIGLIPSISLVSTNYPTKVANTTTPVFSNFTLGPNPAADYVNVNVTFPNTANEVSYTVIDAGGHFVSKTIHNNVKSEQVTINTASLASGMYYMVVVADGKEMFKKFTVIK